MFQSKLISYNIMLQISVNPFMLPVWSCNCHMIVAASRKKFVDVARKFFQRKKKLKPTYPSPVLDWQAQREGYNQLDNNVSLSFQCGLCGCYNSVLETFPMGQCQF